VKVFQGLSDFWFILTMAYKQRWLEYFDALDADGSGDIDPGDLSYATKVY
jgi:Ca2+-binding EF-hand superfamily protein